MQHSQALTFRQISCCQSCLFLTSRLCYYPGKYLTFSSLTSSSASVNTGLLVPVAVWPSVCLLQSDLCPSTYGFWCFTSTMLSCQYPPVCPSTCWIRNTNHYKLPVVHSAVFGPYSYLLHLTKWACRSHEADIEGHMMRLTGVTCSFKHGCLTLHRTDPCFKNPLLFICHSMTSVWILVVAISHCVVTITHWSLAFFLPTRLLCKKNKTRMA